VKVEVAQRFTKEFGPPSRETKKVKAWEVHAVLGVVLEIDQPRNKNVASIWIPFMGDNPPIPDFALEYPGEAGRHSNTYPSPGLEHGKPSLKLVVNSRKELDQTVEYIRAMRDALPLSESRTQAAKNHPELLSVDSARMPPVEAPKLPENLRSPDRQPLPKRQPIPKRVKMYVWQRDRGRCVECSSKEKLEYDHIIPLSKGGSNTERNIQLLCERCNRSKGSNIS
jgi:hypothetical protein